MKLGRTRTSKLTAKVTTLGGEKEVEARVTGEGWSITKRIKRKAKENESAWVLTHDQTGMALPINAPFVVLQWVREILVTSELDWAISAPRLRKSRAHVMAIIEACGVLGVTPPKGSSKFCTGYIFRETI